MSWEVRVVPNRYVDSVRLMQVAQTLRSQDGVQACEVLMGTPANLEALSALGAAAEAAPTDIVIAVDGPAAALDAAERELATGAAPGGDAGPVARPRSLVAAARELPGANVAIVSVPGDYAVLEAHRALTAGMHVFLFSDHVSVADELALKRRGAEHGLLVMGPECGTAMLGGVGLGFANEVRAGSVGIVAAAGTGAQEASVLLDRAGVGVSQIVGVGGRDLSADVGGIMFRQGMKLLAADDGTDTLLLVSKPPDPDAVRALGDVDVGGKRVVAAFVGWYGGDAPFEVHPTLEAGACAAARAGPPADGANELTGGGELLGLFSGGSLAHEAQTILGPGHRILDLGDEEYTQGRPHPMVDLELRRRMLREDGQRAGCVLLDVVLGHGAHPDPAGELAPTLGDLAERRPVIAHVCGTDADPQDASRQETILREAGVVVAPTNAAAARLAARVVAAPHGSTTRGGS
jgi:FdrA protein